MLEMHSYFQKYISGIDPLGHIAARCFNLANVHNHFPPGLKSICGKNFSSFNQKLFLLIVIFRLTVSSIFIYHVVLFNCGCFDVLRYI